jgi:hypothetical protein
MNEEKQVAEVPAHPSRTFSRIAIGLGGSAAASLIAAVLAPAILPVAGAALLGLAGGLLADKLNNKG